MKKIMLLVFSCLLFLMPISVFAEEVAVADNSTPRFMVIGYELSEECVSPDKTALLKITFKNYSNTKAVFNIKLSFLDPSGEIQTLGMPTKFVSAVYSGNSYTWEIELKAVHTASIGHHDLIISSEYEDKYYNSYSSSDTVRISVCQSVNLSYSGAILPKKVEQGSTQTVAVELMNTGKSTIYNCIIDFDIENMMSGGSTFVGNIAAAQSAETATNLRVAEDKTGEINGKIIISYEDDFGKIYTETVDISTFIEEKAEQVMVVSEKDEKKNLLWWLFMLIGILIGAALVFCIQWIVKDKKQRKEDDLRL